MAFIDLKKEYYSVRIAEEYHTYLCFWWSANIYQFTCLPHGVSEGPKIFTKLMKPVFSKLRKMSHTITSYLDDMLMCSSSQSACYTC